MVISAFKNVKDVSNPVDRDVMVFLKRIKEGANKERIEKLREGDTSVKETLPAYTFSGKFKIRNKNGLIQHSGLICLDFDKVDDVQELKSQLCSLPYVFAAFTSPSGNGLKLVVKVYPDETTHLRQFLALQKEIDSEHLDESGKDVCRLCFESYDPDIYINEKATIFDKMETLDIEHIGKPKEEIVIAVSSDHEIIRRLQVWFDSKYNMNEGSRNNNLFIFASTLNRFGITQNIALSHLQQYAQVDFLVSEIEKVVNSAYRNGAAEFHTQYFEDFKKKTEIEKQVFLGTPKKKIADKFPEATEEILDQIKENTVDDIFWDYNSKGNVNLSPHKFKAYLEQNNYHKFFPSESDTYTFIRKEGSLIEETNEKHIKDFVLDDLLNREGIGFKPYDYMASKVSVFTPQYLSLIGTADVNIKKDTKDTCYLYYRNCVVEIKKGKREIIDYMDLDGYVWKERVINRDYKQCDHHKSEFRKFIWLISGKDVDRYNSLKSILGYLLHSYKTSSNNKAIILNDEVISENPNGGSGKGIIANALGKLKKLCTIDGKTFDFQKSFPYQTVSADCQVLCFDDVRKNFNFEALFSVITEGITLEYKNQPALKIPVEDSGKILITTNYTVGGVGGSFERRKFEVELSAYFGAHHSPEQEFGHMLFDDWNMEEWAKFDNYMMNCVEYFLENGLVKHDFKNLQVRKFIKQTSFEFYEWTKKKGEAFNLNTRNEKKETFDSFIEEYQDHKKWLTQKRFKSWLESYADFYGFKYFEGRSHFRWFEISTGETIEEEEEINEMPF